MNRLWLFFSNYFNGKSSFVIFYIAGLLDDTSFLRNASLANGIGREDPLIII